MAQGDAVAAAITRRIQQSQVRLTMHFPPPRVAAVVVGPGALPVSPLTGPAPAPTLVPAAEAAPEFAPMELRCLWLDTPLAEALRTPMVQQKPVGWVDGADALARLLWADVAIDADDPALGTWFDRARSVEQRGLQWRVLKVQFMGPSFRPPHSVSVWLVGANT